MLRTLSKTGFMPYDKSARPAPAMTGEQGDICLTSTGVLTHMLSEQGRTACGEVATQVFAGWRDSLAPATCERCHGGNWQATYRQSRVRRASRKAA